MPNDPRVKFKKKIHDLCGNHMYLVGGGSGRRGGRSIFEDGTPPDRPPGGGEPPPQTTTTTVTDFAGVPQPIKPSLNPGEITGITIGAIAAGAAFAELSRRAYLQHLEEEQGRRGMQPVSQRDAPIKPRKGGKLLERVSRIPRNVVNVAQQFEMTPTPSRPAGPIQADFAPVSVESSPSSSGASTPSAQSARSSAGSSADLQSARSRPSSGTTTPAPAPAPAPAQLPTPEHQRIVAGGPRIGTADNVVMREPIHKSLLSPTALDTDPNRLSTIFTTPEGTIGEFRASPFTKPLKQIRKPDVALDLQNELQKRYLEIQNPNVSEARTKFLQREIRVLEREIRASGGNVITIEDAIRVAMETPMPRATTARAAIDIPTTRPLETPTGLPEYPGFIETGSNTLSKRVAKMKSEGRSQAEIDKVISIIQTNQTIKDLNPPNLTLEKHIEMMELDIKNPSYSASKVAELQKNIDMLKTQKEVDVMDVMTNKAGKLRKKIQLAERDLKKPNVPLQDKYLRTQKTRAQNQLNKLMEEIDLKLMNPQMPKTQRQALVAEHQRAQELLTTLEPQPKLGISKAITPPSTPQRVQEGIEMRPTERKYFAEIGEIVEATMQKMGSRTPLEPSVAGRAALERARLQRVTTQLSETNSSEVGIESRGRLSNDEYRQLLEGLPEDEILEMQSLRERLNKLTSEQAPERPAPVEAPVERPQRPQENFGTELLDASRLTFRDKPLDKFNSMYDLMTERWRAYYSDSIPTAPETMTEIQGKKYIMEQILKEQTANGDPITVGDTTKVEITLEEALDRVQTAYDRTDPPISEEISTKKSLKPDKRRKLTKQTELLATEEQRLRPTALAGEAQATVRARQSATAAAPEARAAAAPEMRATAPEARAMSAAPEIITPEIAARRRMGVPELTAPPAVAPTETASFAERRAFFEETSKVKPPIGEPAPSAPPSAPETEVSTPRETVAREQTPAERAAFAEELTGRLSTKKVPGRQKAKINFGKSNTTTKNPLDIFVNAQHRNIPSTELHPGAKNLRGVLSELGSRVPKLIPTKAKLISMGGNMAAEGGGMIAGYFAGSAAGQEMSKYFATNPPKNRGEEYGQALATSMVALGVGNLTAKAVGYAIRQGVSYALMGEVSGSISSAGLAGATALAEAAAFATIATTTQFFTTKALEDAGWDHSYSRRMGALAATHALIDAEAAAFIAKGGPFNPAAIVSFMASEIFICGFGLWSYAEEWKAGAEQDEAEAAAEEAQREEIRKAREEQEARTNAIVKINDSRGNFFLKLGKYDYDFDKAYAALSNDEREAMGILSPEGKASFQAQVESAFDPFNAFQESPPGVEAPVVLSGVEKDRRDVFNEYIAWYINRLRGDTITAFNANEPRVKELEEYSGGTWQSAAAVVATTNYAQSERVHPLIENAQNEIVTAFHNERKTIEEMDPEVVRYANLDPNFRNGYEAYIVTEAQAQILIEFNRTQFTYNDMDPKLVEIAMRDPTFRETADTYYQVLANQARDLNLPISKVAELNSLMERDQAIEIGKLNDARNLIISRNQAENQASIDSYNASILREINAYGPNFEAIIRNINDQALLTGHTFLYGTTPAALYEQLHMEMPELELVDPDDEIDEKDQPDATWHPGKGRKVGDTAIYSYRYNLTDEQNQELDELARREYFINDPEEMKRRAAILYERDRYLYEQTDQERAADLGMTLEDYYAKYGIPVDPATIPIPDFNGTYPKNGRVRMPNGNIETYKNGVRTKIETPEVPYNPDLPQQPNGNVVMPDGSVRTYLDGKVTFVRYKDTTPEADRLTPDQINAKEKPPITPIQPGTEPTYEQLQQQYPETYKNLLRKYGDDPTGPAQIEATLRKAYTNGFNETTGETNSGLTPGGQPVEPITREPTYEELKVMYPDKYTLFSSTYKSMHPQASQETIDKQTELYLKQQYEKNPVPLPEPTPSQPKQQVLFSGDRTMPDGTTRVYVDGKIVTISYPPGYPKSQMQKLDKQSLADLNKQEGLYYVESTTQPETPTQPTSDGQLKNGNIVMPNGSTRKYVNGLVVQVSYPGTIPYEQQLSPQQINDAEGVRSYTYIGPETPVETNKSNLKQGLVTTPDGAKRIYKDGLVVSVSYPEGKTGKTINEINTSEGVQTGTREPTYAELQIMYKEDYEYKQRTRPDSVVEAELRELYKTEPVPMPTTTPAPAPAASAPVAAAAPAPQTTASSLNLAVAPSAPTPAPATTSMPETTTPGIAN